MNDKVILVTGGARGMGAAHARLLVAEGARVVITDILHTEGEALAAELGGSAFYVGQDVTQPEEWAKAVASAERHFGALHGLVNNAGIANMAPIEQFPLDQWNKTLAVNLTGVFLGMQAALPAIRRADGGSIVNVSSVEGAAGQCRTSRVCRFEVRRAGHHQVRSAGSRGLGSPRDGHMCGDRITILERLRIPGGALDGNQDLGRGFVVRGGREMEDHFECLWDLFRSIPSLETEGASVLDEFYWLNKDDPNYSLQRATVNQGQDARTDGLFTLSEKAQKELIAILLASREEMENKRIDEVFGKDFFNSNFWLYWRTMFAFQEWHSALEMKLYLHRFIHHIGGLPDFSALKFTKYNQYESLVLALCKWLLEQGVNFRYDVEVTDVDFDIKAGCKQATAIHAYSRDGDQRFQAIVITVSRRW
ncbi:oleate hydratase [Bradyrhizobium sp. USDA 10063]